MTHMIWGLSWSEKWYLNIRHNYSLIKNDLISTRMYVGCTQNWSRYKKLIIFRWARKKRRNWDGCRRIGKIKYSTTKNCTKQYCTLLDTSQRRWSIWGENLNFFFLKNEFLVSFAPFIFLLYSLHLFVSEVIFDIEVFSDFFWRLSTNLLRDSDAGIIQ